MSARERVSSLRRLHNDGVDRIAPLEPEADRPTVDDQHPDRQRFG